MIWILLIILTLLGYYFADKVPALQGAESYLILFFSGVKFCLIAYYFMELGNTHFLWKGIMALLVFGFFGGVALFF